VNRNVIGAVVGVQPFGGRGLSGTGPKAGGPQYLGRLVTPSPIALQHRSTKTDTALLDLAMWLEDKSSNAAADSARHFARISALGHEVELPGPVGERNIYALHPRGLILLAPETVNGLYHQLGAVLATGNCAVIDAASGLQTSLAGLPSSLAGRISWSTDWIANSPFGGALVEGEAERIQSVCKRIAAIPGPLVLVQAASAEEIARNPNAYNVHWLLEEVSTSINMAAAGGNASLMAIG
jgi:RHH-type proline utilization regulon transcriptional repressor/proline dehydrogenase/delta 1-pyrroline-5-carboxylate dehydrogenase